MWTRKRGSCVCLKVVILAVNLYIFSFIITRGLCECLEVVTLAVNFLYYLAYYGVDKLCLAGNDIVSQSIKYSPYHRSYSGKHCGKHLGPR